MEIDTAVGGFGDEDRPPPPPSSTPNNNYAGNVAYTRCMRERGTKGAARWAEIGKVARARARRVDGRTSVDESAVSGFAKEFFLLAFVSRLPSRFEIERRKRGEEGGRDGGTTAECGAREIS